MKISCNVNYSIRPQKCDVKNCVRLHNHIVLKSDATQVHYCNEHYQQYLQLYKSKMKEIEKYEPKMKKEKS